MKRFLIFCLVLAFVAAIPLSHSLMAVNAAKVEICHVNSANDVLELAPGFVVAFGRVIEVSPKAVPALEKHGDSTIFGEIDSEVRDLLEELWGITLPNADCIFLVQ